MDTLVLDEKLKIETLVPPEAAQGWSLKLYELGRESGAHHPCIRRQILLVADGELEIAYTGQKPTVLRESDCVAIDRGQVHALYPREFAQFFAVDLPALVYPQDGIHEVLPTLDPTYFRSERDGGSYAVHALGQTEKWSAVLIELRDSPRHFHKIEREVFVVVNGKLEIEIDGVVRALEAGEFVKILPGTVHRLRSASTHPVRLLCFNFPAFDLADMHCV